jgi:GNAT superfamily N-acetyltransferase
MTIEVRYTGFGEYHRISQFLDKYWAKNHVYVREAELFGWTFSRSSLWDQGGYSFALAEDRGEIVGIFGAIPFVLNSLGQVSWAIWTANFMVRPEYRRGPVALRLLNMFRRPPYDAVIAFGINPSIVPLYRALRAQILSDMPRHVAVLPGAKNRMLNLLRMAYPEWPAHRAEALAHAFRLANQEIDVSVRSANSLPPSWDSCNWPQIASQTVGAARDLDYLRWRYQEHPCFTYRFIIIPEGDRTGLAVWRLETIRRLTSQGPEAVDRIGRLVEFLPASRNNAQDLLSLFWRELYDADALGADYYGYHGTMGGWLREFGFHGVEGHPDGHAIPSRFQPLERSDGCLRSAVFVRDEVPKCSIDSYCVWYWTKSDADQDRPN